MHNHDGTPPPTYRPTSTPASRFGIKLAELRSERGLTQLQLATASELDRSYISDLENGKKAPTIDTLAQLAEVFSMTISQLVKGV
jgi:transcriptional regulator with XRE-family HTH domain